MQRQHLFFFFLLLLGAGSAAYFSVRFMGAVLKYCALKQSGEAHILRWEVKEESGKFPIYGYYYFEAGDASWPGSTRLGEPWHLNENSAVAALKERAKERWTVWFNPQNPSESTLERFFPVGLLIRMIICYIVFSYFVLFVRRSVKNNYN